MPNVLPDYGKNKMLRTRFSKFSVFTCILLLCGCCLFTASPAQGYRENSSGTRVYGGEGQEDDWGKSIILTKDVGLAMAGSTESYGAGESDMWLIRTVLKPYSYDTGSGAYQAYAWNKTYGDTGDEAAKQVIQSSDEGFALAGSTNSSGAGGLDMFLVKTNVNGDMMWNSTFGGTYNDCANSIMQTNDGGYVLAGYTSISEDQQATWVVKTDSSGTMEWNQIYPGLSANSVILGSDGTFVLAVDFPGSFGLMKLSPSGELLLNQTFPAVCPVACAESIVESKAGGYAIAGWIENEETDTVFGWLVKCDTYGNLFWDTIIDDVRLYSTVEMSNGNYAMCGDYASVVIVDSFGTVQFNRPNDNLSDKLRSSIFTAAYSIIEASPLHFVMAGAQNSSGQYSHGYNALLMTYNLVADTTAPTIQILSPINGETYPPDDVPLTFYADSSTVRLWYSIDDQGNDTLTGNMTLPTLTEGTHKITVYGQDETHNTAASEPAKFVTQTVIINITTNVAPQTTEPTATQATQEGTESATIGTESDQNFIILAAVVGLLISVLGILGWYLKKDIPSSTDKRAKSPQ